MILPVSHVRKIEIRFSILRLFFASLLAAVPVAGFSSYGIYAALYGAIAGMGLFTITLIVKKSDIQYIISTVVFMSIGIILGLTIDLEGDNPTLPMTGAISSGVFSMVVNSFMRVSQEKKPMERSEN